MSKKKDIRILICLLVLLIVINYDFLDDLVLNSFVDYEIVKIDRVIDGDTIVVGNESIRLLGINSPERGEKGYDEAKNFLNNLVLNKSVRLEFGKDKYDKYGRMLAYVFLNNENVNLKIVQNGFANFYFPSGKDEYYDEFADAWGNCVNQNINFCEKSSDSCANCIELKEFSVEEQKVVLYNRCDLDCDMVGWKIKDEGRKNFVFENYILKGKSFVEIVVGENKNYDNIFYWSGNSYVWTEGGDTLFLRDRDGKLVLFYSY